MKGSGTAGEKRRIFFSHFFNGYKKIWTEKVQLGRKTFYVYVLSYNATQCRGFFDVWLSTKPYSRI